MPVTRRRFIAGSATALATATLRIPPATGAPLPAGRLRELRDAVRGRVVVPGGPGYEAARLVFNRRFDDVRPPAVVRVRDAADVRAVVRWAARHDVPLTPRSGGNAYNGASTSRDAVVVDLGGLDRISLAGRVASVGPGARNIDVYTSLAARGCALPSGSCPNIALGGLVLGGGMGLAGRELGLTLDRVTGFDVVTADGRSRTVDARSDEDLFWALRGGGGSFALVTEVRLRVRGGVRRAAWFRVTYPRGSRDESLAAWDALAPSAPRALTSICTLTGSGASAFGQYFGSERALRRLVAPLARVPGARLSVGTDDYLGLQRRWAACSEAESVGSCRAVPRSSFAAASIYVGRRLSADGRRAFLRAADGGATLVCDAYGGAINAVDADTTAFVHRDARFSVQILSYAPQSVAQPRVGRAYAAIRPFGNGEAYQNYADPRLSGARTAWYGANLPRLVAVKRAVDPDDRFRVTQGIRA